MIRSLLALVVQRLEILSTGQNTIQQITIRESSYGVHWIDGIINPLDKRSLFPIYPYLEKCGYYNGSLRRLQKAFSTSRNTGTQNTATPQNTPEHPPNPEHPQENPEHPQENQEHLPKNLEQTKSLKKKLRTPLKK